MRYVPNLIPNSLKVLPNRFKGSPYKSKQSKKTASIFSWIGGILLLLGALSSLPHLVPVLLFALTGIILLPPGQHWLEDKLRFRFDFKPKALFVGGLLLFAFPILGHYASADEKLALQQGILDAQYAKEQVILDQQNEAQRAIAAQKAKQQRDSLNYYLEAAQKFQKEHKSESAEKNLALAFALAATPEDRADVERTRSDFNAQNTLSLVKGGKYSAALPRIELLIAQRGTTPELLYNRALCYSKTGKEAQAVADCKAAMQGGSKEAEKLHDKINPIRRHVTGYVTRCCDGTISYSSGRGTCSHHGGVCDWNEPTYQESRKYE